MYFYFCEILGSYGDEYEDGLLRRVVWYIKTDVSEVLTVSFIRAMSTLMMRAVSTSETSVNIYETTRRNIPEDSQPSLFLFLFMVEFVCRNFYYCHLLYWMIVFLFYNKPARSNSLQLPIQDHFYLI
jgi:hypothetical protein